jgi:uncharacterized membrane protein YdjX (TVP38/TMEM64 family)
MKFSLRSLIPDTARQRRRAWVIIGVGFLFVIAVSITAWLLPQGQILRSADGLQAKVQSLGPRAPLFIIGYEILQVLIPPLPGEAIDVVNGYVFGPVRGSLYSCLGVAIGSLIALWLARRFGRPLLHLVWPSLTKKELRRYVSAKHWWFWVVLLWLPGAPDDAVSYIIGLTDIPWLTAYGIILIARMPQIILSVVLGAHLRFISPWWFLAGLVLTTVVVLWWSKKQSARR